jgi:hypothetical protein
MGVYLKGDSHVVRGVTINFDAPEPVCIAWLDTDRSVMSFLPSRWETELNDTIDYYVENGWRQLQ